MEQNSITFTVKVPTAQPDGTEEMEDCKITITCTSVSTVANLAVLIESQHRILEQLRLEHGALEVPQAS
jgi:hypothetical protein